MTTHLSNEQIESYCERCLSLADLAHVNTHLFGCELCYDQFLTVFQARRSFPIEVDLNELAGLKSWHLQGDELKSYLEGRLGETDLALANTHLRECAWCREEVHHLSEFTDRLQYYLSKRHVPLRQPALLQRYRAKLDIQFWQPLALVKATALALLLIGSAVILWSMLRATPKVKEARLPASSQESTQLLKGDMSEDSRNTNDQSVAQATQPIGSDKPEGIGKSDSHIRGSRDSSKSIPKGSGVTDNRQDVESLLIAQHLKIPRIVEMFDRSPVILRSGGSQEISFRIVSPYATVIREDQPTFRWTPLPGAVSYRVSVYDDKLNLIEKSESIIEFQWPVPRRLKRGVIYTWVVTAIKDNNEIIAPELPARAEFKVIENSELIALDQRIKQISSKALRGVMFAKAGLLDEAEQEFRSHLEHHAADLQAKKLHQIIKSWRDL